MEDSYQSGVDALVKLALGQMMLEVAIVMVLMFILIMAALYDYRERRIPNFLSFSGWLLGPLLHFAASGPVGINLSLLGLLVVLMLTFPLWMLGSIGAGDVKLMATVGALVGSSEILIVMLAIALAGLVYAVVIVMFHLIRNSVATKKRVSEKMSCVDSRAGIEASGSGLTKDSIPYAIPIAFGTFVALLLTYQ